MKKRFSIFILLMPQKAKSLYFKTAVELEADQENTKPKLLILEMVFPLKTNLLQFMFLLIKISSNFFLYTVNFAIITLKLSYRYLLLPQKDY